MKLFSFLFTLMLATLTFSAAGKELPTTDFNVQGETIAMLGLCEAGEAQKLVANDDWEVQYIPGTSKALCGVFHQDIEVSEVGPYDELIFTVLVKRKDVDPLPLSVYTGTNAIEEFQYIGAAQQTFGEAILPEIMQGLPNSYGFYNHSLLVSNNKAVKAGIVRWNYPKIKYGGMKKEVITSDYSQFKIWKSNDFKVTVSSLIPVIDMPLTLMADNVMPDNGAFTGKEIDGVVYKPRLANYLSQTQGFLTTENGAVMAADVQLTVKGNSANDVINAWVSTEFKPTSVYVYRNLNGFAKPLYVK